MTDAKPEYTCIHEDEFQSHSRKITELETRADYKEEMIREMKQEMKDLNDKMDKLTTVSYTRICIYTCVHNHVHLYKNP